MKYWWLDVNLDRGAIYKLGGSGVALQRNPWKPFVSGLGIVCPFKCRQFWNHSKPTSLYDKGFWIALMPIHLMKYLWFDVIPQRTNAHPWEVEPGISRNLLKPFASELGFATTPGNSRHSNKKFADDENATTPSFQIYCEALQSLKLGGFRCYKKLCSGWAPLCADAHSKHLPI